MTELLRDLRLAARQLLRRPSLSGLAVLSLALGIGVNSAMFSIVNAVLLRDLPAARPGELVEVYTSDSGGFRYATSSYPDYRDFRRASTSFAELAAWQGAILTFDAGERPALLFGEEVSANYFDLLEVRPALGRWFLPEEEASYGTHPVVVLSHTFWQQHFAGSRDVLGRSIRLNGTPFTVVGVAAPTLRGSFPAFRTELWLPLVMHDAISEDADLEERGSRSLFLKGRLAPGVTAREAQAELATLAARLAAAHPDTNEDREISVVPSLQVALNPGFDGPLLGVAGLLMVVVALVLLIACSNIANLLLARAADRHREIAVRLALGAGRGRLIRQLLSESLLLALAGGVAGLLLADWLVRLIVGFRPPLPVPLSLDLSVDARVLAFNFAVATAAGLLCGLAPALRGSRPRLVPALKGEAEFLGRRYRKLGLRNVLVVAQVAVSTVLLLGAGLFVRSLIAAQSIDPGFSLRKGVVAQVALGFGSGYSEEEGRVFFRRLEERVAALPGVRSAALAEHLPLGLAVHTKGVELDGVDLTGQEDDNEVDTAAVGPGYFETLGISLPWGRAFGDEDGPGDPAVVIVNETAARRFWPGESPLGKRLRFKEGEPWREVVGVAADGKYRTLGEEPRPFIYRSFRQDYSSFVTLAVAGTADEADLLRAVRHEVETLDPDVPLFDIRTVSEHLSIMLFPARLGAWLLAAFGALGLVLASVGLYGVVAYAVSQRTREVGIRRAIGAQNGDVLRLIVREGMALVAVGSAVGLAVALVAARGLGSLLYGVHPADPVTFVAVPLLLAGVALLANLLPARRATAIDPMEALRRE